MSLNIQDKHTIIVQMNTIAKNALSLVVADASGVIANEMNKLRSLSRQEGIYIRIIRNTLMNRIVQNTHFECLKNNFIGPTLIAFSTTHPGSAARLFKNFAKNNNNFQIKLAVFEGKVLSALEIDYLATLPTYKEGIIQLILVIKNAAISKLLRMLITISNSIT